MNDLLERLAVRCVREALARKGVHERIVVLEESAATAEAAAAALGVELGAIVKSLVFLVGPDPVLVLVAGDRRCAAERLPELTGLQGEVRKADAATVQKVTGFSIGGVAPVGLLRPLPTVIDASLGRFPRVYAAAGHPHCLFETNLDELAFLTGGRISEEIAVEA